MGETYGVSHKACGPERWCVIGTRSRTLISSLFWDRGLAPRKPFFYFLAHRGAWNWPICTLKSDERCFEVLESCGKQVKGWAWRVLFLEDHCRWEAQEHCAIKNSPASLSSLWMISCAACRVFPCVRCLISAPRVIFPVLWSWRWFLKTCSWGQTEVWAEKESPFWQKYLLCSTFPLSFCWSPIQSLLFVLFSSYFYLSHTSKVKMFIYTGERQEEQWPTLTFLNRYSHALYTSF